MGNSATAYLIFMKVKDLHASKSEECEKEGTNFSSLHELISVTARHVPYVLGIIIMCVSSLRKWPSRSLVAKV